MFSFLLHMLHFLLLLIIRTITQKKAVRQKLDYVLSTAHVHARTIKLPKPNAHFQTLLIIYVNTSSTKSNLLKQSIHNIKQNTHARTNIKYTFLEALIPSVLTLFIYIYQTDKNQRKTTSWLKRVPNLRLTSSSGVYFYRYD